MKLHAHGAPERDRDVLIGRTMAAFHEALARRAADDPTFHYHYVTAREMYNLARAAEAGWQGSVADARDFELIYVWDGPALLAATPTPGNPLMTRDDERISRRAFQGAAAAIALGGVTGCLAGAREDDARPKDDPILGPGASLRGRRLFPADNAWNQEIAGATVDPHSEAILSRIGLGKPLHPDFGTVYQGAPNGIPYTVVPGSQPKVPVRFRYADESDPGPYPIPPDAPIEGGPNGEGDRLVLVVDRDHGRLYELFSARKDPDGRGWSAGSGAIFDLNSNALRPPGWTSADAAGLPIFPGLVRFDEVVHDQVVRHAFRFTVVKTRRGYVFPARHFASPHTDADLPPQGMRVRLRKVFDVSRFPPQARVILTALKTHGMILADNGGDWFLSGAPDPRWDDEDLATMKRVKVRDFEVIRMGEVVTR